MEYLYVSIPRTTIIMTRYKFKKKIYKDYIVLITKKNKIITYNKDKELLDFLNIRKLKELKKFLPASAESFLKREYPLVMWKKVL